MFKEKQTSGKISISNWSKAVCFKTVCFKKVFFKTVCSNTVLAKTVLCLCARFRLT